MSDQQAGQSDFLPAVSEYIDQSAGIAEGSGVIVGVSGGADSVALLAVLRELAPRRGWDLHVAHLDHGLRPDSPDDARWVAQLAHSWDVPCHTARMDIPALARKRRIGIEEASRLGRYRFFRRLAGRVGASVVAVAHHRDDNVETVLQRICRGTHLRGLAGIAPVRSMGGGLLLVRPLLCVTRSRIERFLSERELSWRVDATNRQTRYDRNFIRHELLPLLRDRLNPRVDRAVDRLSRGAAAADTFLRRAARRALAQATLSAGDSELVLDKAVLARLDPAPLGVCVRLMLERMGRGLKDVSAEHFSRLEETIHGRIEQIWTLPGQIRVRPAGKRLILEAPAEPPTGPAESAKPLEAPGETVWGDLVIRCRLLPAADVGAIPGLKRRGAAVEVMDWERIEPPLIVRPRREGDVFTGLGAPGRQNVGDFLTNIKASPRVRRELGCICDQQGIVYLAPLRIADRVRLSDTTRRVLQVTVTHRQRR